MGSCLAMEAESAATQGELPLFPQEEWYEQLLRYGLYVGAVFQIICILAIIFDVSPPQKSGGDLGGRNSAGESSSDDESEDEDHSNQQRNRRRIERKKRR